MRSGHCDPCGVDEPSPSFLLRRWTDEPLRSWIVFGPITESGATCHTPCFGPCPYEVEPFPHGQAYRPELFLA